MVAVALLNDPSGLEGTVAQFDRIAVLAVITIMMFAPAVASGQTTPAAWNVGVGYQLLHIPDETYPLGMNFDVAVPIVPSTRSSPRPMSSRSSGSRPTIKTNLALLAI